MYIINGRFLTTPITGIGRFSLEMCRALQRSGVSFKLVIPKKYKGKIDEDFNFDIEYFGNFDSHLWEQTYLYYYAKQNKKFLLINFSGIGPIFYKNKVTTIHDVSFLENPKWFSKSYYFLYKTFTPIICRYSKFIITVSEFSKSEIIKYYNIEAEKILVLYNATDFHLRQKVDVKFNFGKYILGVFSLDPRKNYHLLITAFTQLKLKDYKLVLVGKTFSNFNTSADSLEKNENVIFTGYVTDEELLSLYQNASLFIYPSLYEGFGIPPLEALILGKNVLLSEIPVFKEIFGDSVSFFQNNSLEDLKEKINLLISNPPKISEETITMIQNKYSWDSSAKKLINKLLSYE